MSGFNFGVRRAGSASLHSTHSFSFVRRPRLALFVLVHSSHSFGFVLVHSSHLFGFVRPRSFVGLVRLRPRSFVALVRHLVLAHSFADLFREVKDLFGKFVSLIYLGDMYDTHMPLDRD